MLSPARHCSILFTLFQKFKKLRAVGEGEKVQQSLILLVSSLLCGQLADLSEQGLIVVCRIPNTFGQLKNAYSGPLLRITVTFICFIHLAFSHGLYFSDMTLQILPLCFAVPASSKYKILRRQRSIHTCRSNT